jgi:hypothetical protein
MQFRQAENLQPGCFKRRPRNNINLPILPLIHNRTRVRAGHQIFVQNHALSSNLGRTQANYNYGLNSAARANGIIKTDLEFILQPLRMGHRK